MKELIKSLIRKPWLVILVVVLGTAFSTIVVRYHTRMETDLDEYMPKHHPAFVFSDEADKRFRIRDSILIVLEHPDSIYNPSTLSKIVQLEEALIQFPEIEPENILSLHTAENILGTEEGLDVKPFFTDPPTDSQECWKIQQTVRSNTMVHGRIVSRDERATLIAVDLPDKAFSQSLYQRLLTLATTYEGPEKIYLAGRPIVEGTMALLGPRDMARMGPLVIGIIACTLLLVLRSWIRTILTLGVVLASTVGSFAIMTTLGIPMYTVTIMVPVMLIAIGVAYGIHLYNQADYYVKSHPGCDREAIVESVIETMFSPVLYAALTTIAGFVSLVTSQVYPVKYFGIFSGLGVATEFFLSMLLIPAGILVFGMGKVRTGRDTETEKIYSLTFGARIADGVLKHPKLVIVGTILVILLSVFGITRVWINTSFLDNFEKDSDIVKTDTLVNMRFGGTSTINVILDSSREDTFKDPAVLELMWEVQRGSLELEKVGDAISLVDYLKRMNRVMHEDREEFDRIPENSDMVAQYLLLYEMSGDPDNLWKVVDSDYKGANLKIQLKSDDSQTIKRVVAYFDTYKDRFAQQGIEVRYAGSGYKSMVFADLILRGQLSSLALSILIVMGLVTLMFRDLRLGFVASIPVSISILVNFGIMGILAIPLTSSTALISSIAVGIGVDYAIHFIERYKETLRQTGDPVWAGRFAMGLTGRAVFLNALIVIAGFMVLLFSVFPPNRQVGALVSLNMFTSFVGTITIMFLVLRKTYFARKESRK